MKYACLVYHEAKETSEISEADLAAIIAECEAAAAWRAELQQGGHHVLSAGLQSPRTARTLRKVDGKLQNVEIDTIPMVDDHGDQVKMTN